MTRFTTLALAMGVALATPVEAHAFDDMTPIQKHKIHLRHVPASFSPAATALARATAILPAIPAAGGVSNSDGLSRNRDECNLGCIDN
jgi:hypothetical protein